MLKILPAAALHDFYAGVFMYNCVRGKSASFLSIFTQVKEVHSHGTGSMNQIDINNFVRSRSGFSLVSRQTNLWYSFNENIKSSYLKEFKRPLKNGLFSK